MFYCNQIDQDELITLLSRYQIEVKWVDQNNPIPGSFWGDSEAGLIGTTLYVRNDTPVHSALHEACHYICMDQTRRTALHTDAAGDFAEENAVCYLQILLAEYITGIGAAHLMNDMDQWGYSFRLGSAKMWFETDAEDARAWLIQYGLINQDNVPTWNLRV